MKHVFSPEGERELDDVLDREPLIAFDFDGTLAPIMATPDVVHTAPDVAQAVSRLALICPVVIITGRSVSDVSKRLGFTPHLIIGNHGAEGLDNSSGQDYPKQVSAWRALIEHQCGEELHREGVRLEDKAYSLSLHYRLAHDPVAAQRAIARATSLITTGAKIFGGKCVVNIVPAGAPDKAEAMFAVMRAHSTDAAIFVGDDLTDESIFQRADSNWMTIRIGQDDKSCARYYLDQQSEITDFLCKILHHFDER